MLQIHLPDSLLAEIESAGVTGSAVDGFVQQAIREKLAADERRKVFYRLSDKMRTAMHQQGLTEDQLLAEFDALRHSS